MVSGGLAGSGDTSHHHIGGSHRQQPPGQNHFHQQQQQQQADMDDLTDAQQQQLEQDREAIRKEIRKELKIKEGAENMRKASTDKKVLENVNRMVKQANIKLDNLQKNLQELNAKKIIAKAPVSNASSSVFKDNRANSIGVANVAGNIGNIQNVANSAMITPQSTLLTDNPMSPEQNLYAPNFKQVNQRINSLQKQLDIELKVSLYFLLLFQIIQANTSFQFLLKILMFPRHSFQADLTLPT